MRHTESAQVCHPGRDSLDRPLVAGQYYFFIQPGRVTQRVQVREDASTGDLYFQANHNGTKTTFRVDDCSQHCKFSRVAGATPDDELICDITRWILAAQHARNHLAQSEMELCGLLGCVPGDGSESWEIISSCVRDGLGTAYDLAQAKGAA